MRLLRLAPFAALLSAGCYGGAATVDDTVTTPVRVHVQFFSCTDAFGAYWERFFGCYTDTPTDNERAHVAKVTATSCVDNVTAYTTACVADIKAVACAQLADDIQEHRGIVFPASCGTIQVK